MRKLAMLGLVLCTFLSHAQVKVSDATVRLLPPGVPNTSAYFTLENSSLEPLVIVGAQASFAESAELHNHVHENNMMRMQQQAQVVIPAGKSIQFAPGGLHIMLFGLKQTLSQDQQVIINLLTKSGEQIQINAKVARPNAHSHH